MMTDSIGKNVNLIGWMDNFYSTAPCEVRLEGLESRIIKASNPSGLLDLFNPNAERIATLGEIATARVIALDYLFEMVPNLSDMFAISHICKLDSVIDIDQAMLGRILKAFVRYPEIFGIWQERLTASTHMVRGIDDNQDKIFFADGNKFDRTIDYKKALEGELSDGGIRYGDETLSNMADKSYSSLSLASYLDAKGGKFNGSELFNHPIFKAALNDDALRSQYVLALQLLDFVSIHDAGRYALWRPGGMKPGFGRQISLGYKGETFYPPNNDTVGHAALVLPIKS
ncbi:MAG: hypothetical protein AABX00_02650 [Nanoarchaeota archaeon]